MGFLAGIGRAVARAIRRVMKGMGGLRKFARGIIKKAVGFVLFVPRAVLAGVFPSVAQRMAEMAAEEEAKKNAAGPSPVHEPEEPEEHADGPGHDVEGPEETMDSPRLSSKPEEPETQLPSRLDRFKNTLSNVKDDLLSKVGLANQSLTAETPKGMGVTLQAANDLQQGVAPVKDRLAASAPAIQNNNAAPPPRQQASKGQKLG